MPAEMSSYSQEVVAMIVHELRNPLAAMANALALCAASDTRQPPSAVYELLSRQLGKAIRLVNELLDVSSLTHEATLEEPKMVDLVRIVRAGVEELEHRFRARAQRLVLELPPDGIRVRGDPMRLGQIVANLLDNSSKYSRDGGSINVSLVREPGRAVLRVRDDGVGIRREDLPHIFDPFFRGRSSDVRAQDGFGVGLALVRRLVALHGGTIEARSDGENCGSEFMIRLPASETSA